jgi:general secretion pathway protein G
MTNRRRNRAFTLIELLLVMVILVVLAAIVLPRFTGRSEEAKMKAARTQISMFDTCLDLFENDIGRYPNSDEGLAALIQSPSGAGEWKGPYIKSGGIPNDPWNRPYVYKFPGERNASGFDLSSMGPDGQDGTADDIGNWVQ